MKKILLLLSITINCYSQNNNVLIENCEVHKNCKTLHKYDEFMNAEIFLNETYLTKKGLMVNNFLTATIFKIYFDDKKSESLYYIVFNGSLSGCVTDTSIVMILLGNNEKIISYNKEKEIDCTSNSIKIYISSEEINEIKKFGISKIRTILSSGSFDYEITSKGNKEFITNLKCMQNL